MHILIRRARIDHETFPLVFSRLARDSTTRCSCRTAWHSRSRRTSTTRDSVVSRVCTSALQTRGLDRSRLCLLLWVHILGASIARNGAGGYVVCDLSGRAADDLPPLLCSLGRVCFECKLMCHGESTADLSLRHILALDVEFLSVNSTDHAVRDVERQFGDWVLSKVVVCLELVEELGGRYDIVVCVVGAHDLALLFERARDEGLSSAVVLVGEADVGEGAGGGGRVDQHGVVALDEAVPFEVLGDALRCADHVAVCGLGVLGLGVDDLQELAHAGLDGLDDVGLELCERVLYTNQVLAVVVLLLDLLVEAVVDAALEDVGVVGRLHVAAVRVEDCRVLAEEFNLLLSVQAGLVDSLTALASSLGELLALVLDLGVQAVEDGEDGALELLGGLVVLVGDALPWLVSDSVCDVQDVLPGCWT